MGSGKEREKEGCERTGIGEESAGREKEKEERRSERGKMWLEDWGNEIGEEGWRKEKGRDEQEASERNIDTSLFAEMYNIIRYENDLLKRETGIYPEENI